MVSAQPVAQHCEVPVQAGPPLQVAVHIPLTQLLPAPQGMPQPPQFWGSLRVLAQPVVGQHC